MALTAKKALAIANGYTNTSIEGITGPLAGKNCTIESQTYANGRNTIVFKWTADNGDVRRTTIVVRDGTPIYEWTSGDDYQYGDLAIYASAFYRCITPNHDIEFDATKWNEIGSPDGNYDIVQDSELLPAIFTAADRKMYFSIEDGLFYLWDGEKWVLQKPKWDDITGKPIFADVATSGSYNDLEDKPEIPTKTSDLNNDSNFVSDDNYVHTDNNYDATAKSIVDGVSTALNGKVDKIENKGLSTNDYTNTDKAIVDNVASSLANKVDKVEGKGLSTNDYDNTAKNIVDGISTALDGKVDKVTGKGLSKNDYTDTDKAIVDGISTALNDKVDKVPGKQLSTNDYTSEEKLKLASLENYDDTEITERISDVESVIPSTATTSNKLATSNDIPDVSNFITNTVDNLINYYTKSQTYTQEEVDALISAIVSLNIKAVEVLPTTNISTTTIYLVPSTDPQAQNIKDEYINIDGTTTGWERIGSTAIDLSDYVTNEDLITALADYTTTANLNTLLAAKQNVISDLATIRSGASAGATAYQKPSTGIPKTDLASAVQTSLGKADSAIQDISGKADKVSSATNGNFAGLDSNGNITDSGKKASDFLTQHQDISGKADKVTNTVSGNFASLGASGNLKDSGYKPSNFLLSTKYEYNKSIASSKDILIGRFPCKDTNITIEISRTAGASAYAVIILSTQNTTTSSYGEVTFRSYADSNNYPLSNSFYAYKVPNESRYDIYCKKTSYGKYNIHIQVQNSLTASPTDICAEVDSIPSEATLQPENMLNSQFTPQSMIGDAWVTSHAYAVGDYCIDGNVLYKCKTAHTSTASNRPPYASYWDAVSVASQLQRDYIKISPLTWTNSMSSHTGGGQLSMSTSHNLLTTAKEVIVVLPSFGTQTTILPLAAVGDGVYNYKGFVKRWDYQYNANPTPTSEGEVAYNCMFIYWNKTNGTLEFRILKWRTDVWSLNSKGNPQILEADVEVYVR